MYPKPQKRYENKQFCTVWPKMLLSPELGLRITNTFEDGIVLSTYVRSHDVGWLFEVGRSAWVADTAYGCAISCCRLTWFFFVVLHRLYLLFILTLRNAGVA